MKNSLLLTVALLLLPTMAWAQVDVIVIPNPEQPLQKLQQSVTLSDHNTTADVSFWHVGVVKLSDFDNYCFAVYKNGHFLDNITNRNQAIFYNGHYVIEVYNRQTRQLINTVSFTSKFKVNPGQELIILLGVLVIALLTFVAYHKIQEERLIRRRGWRYP